MASKTKRQSELEEGTGDDRGIQTLAQHSKRRRGDPQQAETSIPIGDITSCIADLVQRLVREVLDRQLSPRLPTVYQTGSSGARFLRLEFKNELPAIIFTDSKIKAKDDTPVEIALYDIRSHSIVADGPPSKMKIEICVLNGEFDSNEGTGDWTAEEFKAKNLLQRENRGKLLKGDIVITLKNGVGYVTNVQFTDNSSWLRSGKFRLGAKAVQSISINEANIREAKSDPFVVKDSRGNQKRYPPFPSDELWRLTKISKDGKTRQRLSSKGINTVKDLLRLHETDPSSLEKIAKISRKTREAIIEHAKTCVDEKAVTFDGPVNTLRSDEKCLAGREKPHAYGNVKDLIPVDDAAVHVTPSPLPNLQSAVKYDGPDLYVPDFPTVHQGKSMEGNALSFLASQVPPVVPGVYPTETDYSDILFPNDFPFPIWEWEQGYSNCFGGEEFGMHASFPNYVVGTSSMNVKPKPKAAWCKIRALACIIRALILKRKTMFARNDKMG